MIRIPHGRGGSVVEAGGWRATVVAMFAIVALAGAGCSSKKPEGAGGAGEGQPGLGQQGLSGSDSLSQLQKGTLGAGNQGPLSDIHFDYNDSTVRAQDGEILKTNADWLQKNPTTHAQIEGHCDDRGSEEYNLALGAKRAQAAKDYLQTLGVDASRLSTISYGKELPLCSEETDDCWAQNRRDHFAVSQGAEGPQ